MPSSTRINRMNRHNVANLQDAVVFFGQFHQFPRFLHGRRDWFLHQDMQALLYQIPSHRQMSDRGNGHTCKITMFREGLQRIHSDSSELLGHYFGPFQIGIMHRGKLSFIDQGIATGVISAHRSGPRHSCSQCHTKMITKHLQKTSQLSP